MAFTGPRHEADDAPATHLVEHDPVGDLVEPCAGLGPILEGALSLVRLDEGVLREVGGDVCVAHHPEDVGVYLGMVESE